MDQTGITTREFVIADYEGALALWRKEEDIEICEGDSREEVHNYLKRNPGLSRVAEIDGQIVGAVLCGHDGRRGFIYHLAISPEYRGRRLGQRLLADCVRGLKAVGIPRAMILVAEKNSLGRKFWLRNGWEEIEGALPMTREV